MHHRAEQRRNADLLEGGGDGCVIIGEGSTGMRVAISGHDLSLIPDLHAGAPTPTPAGDTGTMNERNVLGGPLEPCGTDPMTGFFRDGCCSTGPDDVGRHTICAVVSAEFLDHQHSIGNDLSTPMPEYRFPGLVPGDRWCVTAVNWLRAWRDGAAAPVVLASTNERTLEVVPLEALQALAVDVPSDLSGLED